MKLNKENYIITVIGFNYRTRKEASGVFFKQGNIFSGYQYCKEVCILVIVADSNAFSSFRPMVASRIAKAGNIPI
jgi:hypothetical protein